MWRFLRHIRSVATKGSRQNACCDQSHPNCPAGPTFLGSFVTSTGGLFLARFRSHWF
jgi:hypothetical protein